MRHCVIRKWSLLVAACMLTAGIGATSRQAFAQAASPSSLSDEQVVLALKKAIDWLFKNRVGGAWETNVFENGGKRYDAGNTALVVYTMLSVGESFPDDRLHVNSPELKPAIAMIKNLPTDLVYLKAVQVMALSKLRNDPQQKTALKAAAADLLKGVAAQGGYLYQFSQAGQANLDTAFDNSSTQFALLAASSILDAHGEVPTEYWQTEDKYWRTKQNTDGGWGYGGATDAWKSSFPSLSCAGVASLYIVKSQLESNSADLVMKRDKNLDAGLAWMEKHYDASRAFDPGAGSGYFSLFAMQRVALAAGFKTIAGKDWYRDGAAALLNRQAEDGSFPEHFYYHDAHGGIIPTCMSLLFLARGRNPVAFNKLQYPGDTWNARPRDSANLTAWMSTQFERTINWQVVSVDSPADVWGDAPILLITGSKDPHFSNTQMEHLRNYIENGGTIFSTADGSTPAFNMAIEKIAAKVTRDRYHFRKLPENHPVFNGWAKTKGAMALWGLSNGARELWVHSRIDLGSTWQRQHVTELNQWLVPANLFFYCSGSMSSLRPKLRALSEAPAGDAGQTIAVANIDLGAGTDPEPGAWPRFAGALRRTRSVAIDFATVAAKDVDAKKWPFAVLSISQPITPTADQAAAIKSYVDAGGTLLIDNCGGHEPVADSIVKWIVSLYPAQPLAPLPDDHPLITGAFTNGVSITKQVFRKMSPGEPAAPTGVHLMAVKTGERLGVIYSPVDLTEGLLGANMRGIVGYTPDTAQAVAGNILLYAISQK